MLQKNGYDTISKECDKVSSKIYQVDISKPGGKKSMKKRWKRIISYMIAITLVIILSISTTSISVKAEASVDGRLITVGGKTVTKSMKIDDVKEMFGEPKLVTPSYWDGYAYTFYGKDYSDYLYLETDSDGKIVCYGSVSPGFETNKYSYGEKVNPYVRAGCEAKDDDGKLYAVIYYTKFHLDAYKRFTENLTENNRNLCKHAVEMWNAISYLYGYKTKTYFDEKLFNIGAQLADNYSDLYDYCKSTNQSSCYQLMTGRKATFLEYFYPNPLEFAKNARNYECPKGNAIDFMYYPTGEGKDDYWIMEGFVNKELLADWKPVAYTEREKELLSNSRKYYTESVNSVNSMKSYYEIKPSYDSIKNIEGGKLSKEVAKGAVDYLNAIRVGAGLNPLEYSEQLSEDAQCKSTYTVYLAKNNIKNSSPHNPPKVEGLSDEYYSKCQSGNGENLYSCGIISTSIIDSISNALDDSQGAGQYYNRGHRYNLLNPEWKYIGVGNTLQQGCHKLSGTQSYDVDVVAWPSKGITISESGFSPSGMWTCQFYNNLKPTDDTTITIECLNSNKKWKIDPNNLLENQDYNYKRSENLISYSDNSIAFKIGGVYKITYDHLTDINGNETSYSYRTVYEKAYTESEDDTVAQSIKLDKTSEKVLIGTTSKLIARVSPDSIENKRIYFASNNPEVATVNECGEITAHSLGTADITATSEVGNITATCKITVVKTLDKTDDQPEKNPEKEPTKDPEKEPTKDPEKEPTKDSEKEPTKDSEKESTKDPVKEPTGVITNGNVNNSNNKSDLSQGHKTNNSKKEDITISKAKIKSVKKKKSSKSLTIILSKAVPKVTGYQIKIYSSKKKAKKNKGAIWTKVVQRNSKKIVIKNKKLKNKKTLYIRIRAYQRVYGKNKYGMWSETKKVIAN